MAILDSALGASIFQFAEDIFFASETFLHLRCFPVIVKISIFKKPLTRRCGLKLPPFCSDDYLVFLDLAQKTIKLGPGVVFCLSAV